MKLLLDPHGDDAALFAAYTCIAEKPWVFVTHATVPLYEIAHGIAALDCVLGKGTRESLAHQAKNDELDLVYVPAPHANGHEEHNETAYWAADIFGPERVRYYLTYAPRGQRDRNGTEVIPAAGAVAKKLRALSCYESQIEQASTRPWFYDLLDMREWLA